MAQERLAQLLEALGVSQRPPTGGFKTGIGAGGFHTRREPPTVNMPTPPPSPFPDMMGAPATGAVPLGTGQQLPIPRHVQMGAPWSDFEESPEQYLNFTQPGGQLGELLGAQATQEVMEDLPGTIEQRTAELQLKQIKDKRAEAEKMRKQLQTLGRK